MFHSLIILNPLALLFDILKNGLRRASGVGVLQLLKGIGLNLGKHIFLFHAAKIMKKTNNDACGRLNILSLTFFRPRCERPSAATKGRQQLKKGAQMQ